MTTAALANSGGGGGGGDASQANNSNSNTRNNNPESFQKAAYLARGLADDASKAIGNLLPTASLQNITTRKYTLPDKTVASQVLMYRQLLHTSCRPGLKLSRPYQATTAQMAVMHMPWWEKGIEESLKMVISYDNLITRLWLNGGIVPFQNTDTDTSTDLLGGGETKSTNLETFINDQGLPPIPHTYWVERLGFQQPDPVTDFRSGGVLSLAMMVYMVESCPKICQRFFTGDTSVLPFGLTCINVTDMMSKFLMLAKSTDRMDALLSQKTFWRMFADPNAILALQETSMSMLCDVVVELQAERKVPGLLKEENSLHGENEGKVTVFDFSTILERTERRVRDDLLGGGPKTVVELRSIAGRLRLKYQTQLERRIQRHQQQQARAAGGGGGGGTPSPHHNKVNEVFSQGFSQAGSFFAKMKAPTFAIPGIQRKEQPPPATPAAATEPEPEPTIVAIPDMLDTNTNTKNVAKAPVSAGADSDEGDWVGADMTPATDAISNFSIGDEDDDDIL